ncbi:MAG: DoxX family protein [Firmicutes bacterium]|nr:DoxX family protein [Bacillota bacterium]
MTIWIWILQGLLGLAFLVAGLGKTFGSAMHREAFERWRLPQWFRVVTGLVEIAAAALLLFGYGRAGLVPYGALLVILVGIGGVTTHVRIRDTMKNTMPILVLGLLGLVLLLGVL